MRPHPDREVFDYDVADREPGADYEIAQPVDLLPLRVAAINLDRERASDRHVPVQAGERHGQLLVDGNSCSRFHARIIALRDPVVRDAPRALVSRPRSSA